MFDWVLNMPLPLCTKTYILYIKTLDVEHAMSEAGNGHVKYDKIRTF